MLRVTESQSSRHGVTLKPVDRVRRFTLPGLVVVVALMIVPLSACRGGGNSEASRPLTADDGRIKYPEVFPTQGPVCDPSLGACPGTIVVKDAARLKEALEEAAEDAVIQVPGTVSIDLDGFLPIRISANGVTLYGGRHGDDRGALLHTEAVAPDQTAAFIVRGDRVSIRNLRLRGPSASTDTSVPRVTGINTSDEYRVTVFGNELYNWTFAAIRVTADEPEEGADCEPRTGPSIGGRYFRTLVLNNYIHHNRQAGVGYGVGVRDGAFPFVIGNTFDWNRHSVTGDGHPGTGYYAAYNYVLSGGSKYGGALTYGGAYGQHFDMHGDDNYGRTAFDPVDDDDGYGGHGGDLVLIRGNTVHGEQKYGGALGSFEKTRAVYWLRGRPCRQHELIENVLVHEEDEVVHAESGGQGQYFGSDNRFDTDTSWSLGIGNFDHGRDDLFQATGAAWYYSSGGATEWRLLQAGRIETLDRLRLGDFDGDRRTDVFTASGGKWRISRGGTERWEDINASRVPLEDLRFGDFDGDRKTDVFTVSGGRWRISRGGTERWEDINASRTPLEHLRFGDFDGDRKTDVFRVAGDQWSVSDDGVSTWERLNSKLTDDLDSLVFADFNGNGRTDIAQSRVLGTASIDWRVSWDGTDGWSPMRSRQTIPGDSRGHLYRHWIGQFDSSPGEDALRYEPPAPQLFRFAEGVFLVRLSGGRGDYVTHSWQGMR